MHIESQVELSRDRSLITFNTGYFQVSILKRGRSWQFAEPFLRNPDGQEYTTCSKTIKAGKAQGGIKFNTKETMENLTHDIQQFFEPAVRDSETYRAH